MLRDVVKELSDSEMADNSSKSENTKKPEDKHSEMPSDLSKPEDTQEAENNNTSVDEEVVDVADLVRMKEAGHNRVSPQADSQSRQRPNETKIQDQFKCCICKSVFKSKEKLKRHSQNHIEDTLQWISPCDGCSYESNEQSDLLNHLLEKHDQSATYLDYLLNKNMY